MESCAEDLLDEFLLESAERVARVETALLSLPEVPAEGRGALLTDTKRELHTLKGNSGMMGLPELQGLAHRLEDLVADFDPLAPDLSACLESLDRFKALLRNRGRALPGGETPDVGERESEFASVRVPFAALDELVDLLAEMVIFRNRLGDAIFRGVTEQPGHPRWEEVQSAREALSKTLSFVQDRVMRLRMVPLSTLFSSLRRIVHDEGRREGKRVRLRVEGGDTPLDKALLEVCNEALGHLVRNAVVHGIEAPEERRRSGKPEEGDVRLEALVGSSEVQVTVSDDGGGLDPEALKSRAETLGLDLPPGSDPFSLLFQPGFSTRQSTDVAAGRGMGLSAAAEAVQRVGGRIEVEGLSGAGCRFTLHLPLSVSITRAMLVKADGEEYALPLSSVVESIRFSPGDAHRLNGAGVVRWRGGVVPLLDLGNTFGTRRGIRREGFAVLTSVDGRARGLVVDELAGMKEIVVKGLDPSVGSPPGIAGSTILGNGKVVLILDPRRLVALEPFVRPTGDATLEGVP